MGKAVVSYIYKILETTHNTYIHFRSLLLNTWTVSLIIIDESNLIYILKTLPGFGCCLNFTYSESNQI